MRKRVPTAILAAVLSTLAAPSMANNSLFDVMRGMVTGMAILGQLSNNPWQGSGYPGAWTHYPPPPGAFQAPGAYHQPGNDSLLQKLQGSWHTVGGELLVVNGNYARLYRSRDQYQDLHLRIDSHFLWIAPSGHRQARQYAHQIHPNQFQLRDAQNNTLEFKRFQPKTGPQ